MHIPCTVRSKAGGALEGDTTVCFLSSANRKGSGLWCPLSIVLDPVKNQERFCTPSVIYAVIDVK